MYHEERLINGILHRRITPDGEFRPYTLEQLSAKCLELQKQIDEADRNYEMQESGLFSDFEMGRW